MIHQSWLGVFVTVDLNICYGADCKIAYGVGIHTVFSIQAGSNALEQ